MTDIAALIERLEAAGGPDRQLDAAIEDAVNGLPKGWVSHPHKYQTAYTASIDAALTLFRYDRQLGALKEAIDYETQKGVAYNLHRVIRRICIIALRVKMAESEAA